jgi:predicted RNase H-like nuclease (RuvC/YqgF family)
MDWKEIEEKLEKLKLPYVDKIMQYEGEVIRSVRICYDGSEKIYEGPFLRRDLEEKLGPLLYKGYIIMRIM